MGMEVMEMGIQKEWIGDLFLTFDEDGGGTIDRDEFLRILFPRAHFISRTFSMIRKESSGTTDAAANGDNASADASPPGSIVSESSPTHNLDGPKQDCIVAEPSPRTNETHLELNYDNDECGYHVTV